MVDAMTKTRAERAAALEAWADTVDPAELRSADTGALRHIAELTQQRDAVDADLTETVQAARSAHCSWSEIGAMLVCPSRRPSASTAPRPPSGPAEQ
jgi:hypothetical protein